MRFLISNFLADRLPPLRDKPLPANNHRQPRIHFQLCPADDGTHLRHCRSPSGDIRLHIGSSWKAESFHHWTALCDGSWICNVSRL